MPLAGRCLHGMRARSHHRGSRARRLRRLRRRSLGRPHWTRFGLPLLSLSLLRLILNCLTLRCRSLRQCCPTGNCEHKAAEQPRAQPWLVACSAKIVWECHALLS
jgi:hypothetical protein